MSWWGPFFEFLPCYMFFWAKKLQFQFLTSPNVTRSSPIVTQWHQLLLSWNQLLLCGVQLLLDAYTPCCVCVCLFVCLSVCNTFLSMRFRDSQQLGSVSRLWPLILASNSFMGATHHVVNLLIVQNLILKSEQLKCDSDISRTMYTPSKFLVH